MVQQLDNLLAQELLDRVKSGKATASELREARAYLNDNKDLICFKPEHPANGLYETLPDLTGLQVFSAH
ncbi:hypothetical protein [Candidatus Enterovibrio escicola]|uniref:hypothetical protein n=1 Tax=Candidatus Enterovibrio escicola TaxID=1927127 RepID=UPI003C12F83C